MTVSDHFQCQPLLLLAGLIVDALVGDPAWIYRRMPHPVALFGALITGLDKILNRASLAPALRRLAGIIALVVLLGCAVAIGYGISKIGSLFAFGWILEVATIFVFVAQRDLYLHVAAVADALTKGGVEAGRDAVAQIVGRDPADLEEAAVSRAALESLAENFSDGVVAPVFWYVIAGLPGLIAYKALNTADSMIGHRSEKYRAFGWAAARLDDIANYLPARLAALSITIAAVFDSGARAGPAMRNAIRDAAQHKSVNAGWPEAAMAGALDLRLAGPRVYDGTLVDDAWMGDGRAEATSNDIRRGLRLYCAALVPLWVFCGSLVLSAFL